MFDFPWGQGDRDNDREMVKEKAVSYGRGPEYQGSWIQ
jgi:hypothetical protein